MSRPHIHPLTTIPRAERRPVPPPGTPASQWFSCRSSGASASPDGPRDVNASARWPRRRIAGSARERHVARRWRDPGRTISMWRWWAAAPPASPPRWPPRSAAFARSSLRRRRTFPPGRTAALLQGSIDVLSELDVWPALAHHAAPLTAIRLVDATKRLIRAPEVTFYASEIGLPAFGYNIPNGDLVDGLRRHAEAFEALTLVATPVDAIAHEEERVVLRAGEKAFSARLVVAADGARSLAREAAGIRVQALDLFPVGARRDALRPASASGRIDGVPHRERPVHAGAAARRPGEPRLGRPAGSRGRRAGLVRRSTFRWRSRSARTRSTARCGSTAGRRSFRSARRSPTALPRGGRCWSARRRISSRRSARRV